MGNNLFGVDIAGIIDREISPNVLPATLIVLTPGTRNPNSPGSGIQPTETPYSCRGFIDEYDENLVGGTLIEEGDKKITLIGNSIVGAAIPKQNDKIQIEGSVFIIKRVMRDPDAATYECQSRG